MPDLKRNKRIPGSITGNSTELRRKAEAFLGRDSTGTEDQVITDAKVLLHELSVHQVELELQNQELMEARNTAERLQEKYFALYDLAPIGYAGFDIHGKVTDINLAGAELVGEPRNRIVNTRFQLFLAQADISRFSDFIINLFRNGVKTSCEVQLERDRVPLAIVRIDGVLAKQEPEKTIVCRAALVDITGQRAAERDLLFRNRELAALNSNLEQVRGELQEKQERLMQSLADKDALLEEVHHRVKNNLSAFISLLSLKGSYEDSPEGKRLKKDLLNRARSMALIHETLYRTRKFSSVDMDVYLKTLIEQVSESYGTHVPVQVHVNAGGVVLDLARATPCGLIINELITNSYKYAFPDGFDCLQNRGRPCSITVSLTEEAGTCLLTISDNGIGIPKGKNPRDAESLGLKLVNILAKHQLRATMEILDGEGTRFLFRFPNNKVSAE